ncbi:uncharacterized protein LOC134928663 [Pseudophryne corroboree]|uniref:uncharacterized protein LOC134928663 n=1 Tax=Pseudophryne corroboree TaxID=495146 RepID=UPI0030819308
MSEGTLPVRRIGTRAAVRLTQESSAMADSDTSSSDTSPSSSLNTSNSPKLEPKLEPKQEPMEMETDVSMSTESSSQNSGITTVQVKDLGLQPLGPSPFTGRKRKANFSNEETETLVKDVVKHFSALYGSEALRTESTRRNQRRSQLWNQIQTHVNDLGYTPRTIDDLKHKWRDLRLEVKRKITHRRTASKVAPVPGATPIIDTKLTPLEDLVASTIGHHCTLDGEQEGLYMEPGVPRQSIFFTCRGPPSTIPEIGSDRLGSTASPRPSADLSIVSPLVSTSPAQLSFVHISEDGENDEQEMDVTHTVTIKPFTETWPAVKEVCTLVATQGLLPTQQTIVPASSELLAVKQEVLPPQPALVPTRCESQSSIVSSPEGSLANATGQTEWSVNGRGDNPTASVVSGDGEMVNLKLEDEDGDSREVSKGSPSQEQGRGNWQENQDEWERQSRSPQPSETAQEDSMPSSSSQDGEPSTGGDLAANGDCACEPDERRPAWRANMHRLLELEEQWDTLYHRELGIWEEERIQQQQQRSQDRELQQQLLGVLTDIRDELRQLRQERATARQNQVAPPANGTLLLTNAVPPAPVTPKAKTEPPVAVEVAVKSTPAVTTRRRGRPRLIKPSPEPVRPIRPAPEPSTSS